MTAGDGQMPAENPQAPEQVEATNLVAFNPNRQLIRVGNHEFILDLNLAEDGTGIARVSVIEPSGNPRLICSAFKQRPEANWEFSGAHGIPRTGPEVRSAARALAELWVSWRW